MNRVVTAAAAAVVVLLLAGCARGNAGVPSSAGSSPATGPCFLVSEADLRGVAGGEPSTGTAGNGLFGDGGCTWQGPAATVALSVTEAPEADLLASAYPRPVSAASVPGADRGWASADRHRIVVVRGERGALLTVAGTARGSQAAYDALATVLLRGL